MPGRGRTQDRPKTCDPGCPALADAGDESTPFVFESDNPFLTASYDILQVSDTRVEFTVTVWDIRLRYDNIFSHFLLDEADMERLRVIFPVSSYTSVMVVS